MITLPFESQLTNSPDLVKIRAEINEKAKNENKPELLDQFDQMLSRQLIMLR